MTDTTDTSALNARYYAREIAERASVAFYAGETNSEPGFHLERLHDNFEKMARALGYRVERIAEKETV